MGQKKNKRVKKVGDKWFTCYAPANANLVQLAEGVYSKEREVGLLDRPDGTVLSFGKWMLIHAIRNINDQVAEQMHRVEQEKAKQQAKAEAEQETPEGFDEATENFKEGVVSDESFEADCPELETEEIFEGIKEGLEEGIAHAKGETDEQG